MKVCFLLPYANPHTTGWIDEFIKITNHEVVVGVINSVKKYRNNHFEESDNKSGYLYFFKGKVNKKRFYSHLRECNYLVSLGIFEAWFFKTIFYIPKVDKILVLSEPFRPSSKKKMFLRKLYIHILRAFKHSSKFSILCMGGELVKLQYSSFGLTGSRFYQFGYFPILQLNRKDMKSEISILKFIFVGKLIPRKGIDILISLIKYLQQKYTNWEFLIIGDGELRKTVMETRDKEGRVQYIENINNALQMKSKFNENHILFLPSYFDGWGAVVNEAISSCCSLLLSENVYAGVELLSDGENGFNFNTFHLNELYRIVDTYFENPEILNKHFQKSMEIFEEWNHKNAATSFNNILDGKSNPQNKILLRII